MFVTVALGQELGTRTDQTEHKGTLIVMEMFYYLDWGGGYRGVYVYQNSSICMLKGIHFK